MTLSISIHYFGKVQQACDRALVQIHPLHLVSQWCSHSRSWGAAGCMRNSAVNEIPLLEHNHIFSIYGKRKRLKHDLIFKDMVFMCMWPAIRWIWKMFYVENKYCRLKLLFVFFFPVRLKFLNIISFSHDLFIQYTIINYYTLIYIICPYNTNVCKTPLHFL